MSFWFLSSLPSSLQTGKSLDLCFRRISTNIAKTEHWHDWFRPNGEKKKEKKKKIATNGFLSPRKSKIGTSFWKEHQNQRLFCDQFGKRFGVKSYEDWYKVPTRVFRANGGSGLLSEHQYKLSKALTSIYPEHPWDLSRFATHIPHGYWKSAQNQREFLDHVANLLQIKSLEEWYDVKTEDVLQVDGAKSLLYYHYDVLSKALEEAYPEFEWKVELFQHKKKFWKDELSRREFFDDLAKHLKIKQQSDWYRVSRKDVLKYGGSGILPYYGNSHITAIQTLYPEYDWKSSEFISRSKLEERLHAQVSELFQGHQILTKPK